MQILNNERLNVETLPLLTARRLSSRAWGSKGNPLWIRNAAINAAGYKKSGNTFFRKIARKTEGDTSYYWAALNFQSDSDEISVSLQWWLEGRDVYDIALKGFLFKRLGDRAKKGIFAQGVNGPMQSAAVFHKKYGWIVPEVVYDEILRVYSPKQKRGLGYFGRILDHNVGWVTVAALVAMGGYAAYSAIGAGAAFEGATVATEGLGEVALGEIVVDSAAVETFAYVEAGEVVGTELGATSLFPVAEATTATSVLSGAKAVAGLAALAGAGFLSNDESATQDSETLPIFTWILIGGALLIGSFFLLRR